MSDISLTASMRSNLLSLQNTQSLMDVTQERLSTGKKVNSAIDNPSSYYTAASLNNRASDLSALLDSMGQGIQTIKAADEGIEAITTFAEQAKALANSARDEANKPKDASISGITALAKDAVAKLKITITGPEGNEVAAKELTIDTTAAVDAAAVQSKITEAHAETGGAVSGGFGGMEGIEKLEFDADGNLSVVAKEGYEVKIEGSGEFSKVSGTASKNNSNRIKSAAQFDSILTQIDQLAADSGYKGVNLL